MGIIESVVKGATSSPSTPSVLSRGTIVDVRTDGLVSVKIPRYMQAETIGPLPTAVADLEAGDEVLVGVIGGQERMVVALADGSQNWAQQPDLTIVPVDGADMDLFKDKGVGRVPLAAASAGDNFPSPLGGLAEAWSRDTGEKVQRYTDSAGRVHVRFKDGPAWSSWAAAVVSADDISDATATGRSILTATDSPAARTVLGLGSVDNTADMDKPLSGPQAAAIEGKADVHNPRFTGDVRGISKIHVGLDQVDNTPDINKPVSEPVNAKFALVDEKLAAKEPTVTPGTTAQYWRGDKSWQTLDKTAVGLANVDNTSDLNKPVSTATQNALNGKANTVHTHAAGDTTSGVFAASLLPAATTSAQGALSAADKTKLDGAASAATVSTLMLRDASGRAQVGAPSVASDIANKSYVDTAVGPLPLGMVGRRARTGSAANSTSATTTVLTDIEPVPVTLGSWYEIIWTGAISTNSGTAPAAIGIACKHNSVGATGWTGTDVDTGQTHWTTPAGHFLGSTAHARFFWKSTLTGQRRFAIGTALAFGPNYTAEFGTLIVIDHGSGTVLELT